MLTSVLSSLTLDPSTRKWGWPSWVRRIFVSFDRTVFEAEEDAIRLDFLEEMMSMLNQAAVEALCSATYLENYLDCMENLPDDLQRVVSQLRELDSQTHGEVFEICWFKPVWLYQILSIPGFPGWRCCWSLIFHSLSWECSLMILDSYFEGTCQFIGLQFARWLTHSSLQAF